MIGEESAQPEVLNSSRDITTLMIRNLPNYLTQQELKDDLDRNFAGMYDFLYMPSEFGEGKGKGYAFVNFTSTLGAGLLIGAWHLKRRFAVSSKALPLNISAASVQGRDANIAKFDCPRLRRIRNPNFRPLVFGTPARPYARRAQYDSNASNEDLSGSETRRGSRESHDAGHESYESPAHSVSSQDLHVSTSPVNAMPVDLRLENLIAW